MGSKFNNYLTQSDGSITQGITFANANNKLAHLAVFFSDQCDGVTGIKSTESETVPTVITFAAFPTFAIDIDYMVGLKDYDIGVCEDFITTNTNQNGVGCEYYTAFNP